MRYNNQLRHNGLRATEIKRLLSLFNSDRRFRLRPRRHHKKRLDRKLSLDTIRQILSVTAFEKTPLIQLLSESRLAPSPPIG